MNARKGHMTAIQPIRRASIHKNHMNVFVFMDCRWIQIQGNVEVLIVFQQNGPWKTLSDIRKYVTLSSHLFMYDVKGLYFPVDKNSSHFNKIHISI